MFINICLFYSLFDCGLLDQAKQTGLRKYFYIFPNFEFSWQWRAGRVVNGDAVRCLGLLHGGGGHGGGGHGGEGGQEAVVGTDHGGVVDDVLGGVVGHVLGHADLGHVLHGVVHVVADVLDHGGGGNHGGGGVVGNSGGGHDLGGGGGHHAGLHGHGGGVGDGLGRGVLHHGHGGGQGVHEAVLVEVLGESLQRQGPVALGRGHEVAHGGGEGSGGRALVDVGDHLGVGGGGGEAGGRHGQETHKLLHADTEKI